MTKQVYCTGCQGDVEARLATGEEIYPHRRDLHELKFWRCNACRNYVGCHRGGSGDVPLGVIATKELKNARMHIHALVDPMWKNGLIKRGQLYAKLAEALGLKKYHTAEIKTIEQARSAYAAAQNIKKAFDA